MAYHIIYHIVSYRIISYHIISSHIIPYHITSYRIISYHIISCHIIPYHIIYHIVSYRITSYHTTSYIPLLPVLPNISQPNFAYINPLHVLPQSLNCMQLLLLNSSSPPLSNPSPSHYVTTVRHTRPHLLSLSSSLSAVPFTALRQFS